MIKKVVREITQLIKGQSNKTLDIQNPRKCQVDLVTCLQVQPSETETGDSQNKLVAQTELGG